MGVTPRAIIHVDMDAFYAAVEQRDDPSLLGRPVIVGGLGRRSVVATASYEARRFGVRSAMPTAQARRLCPDGVFVAPRMSHYQEVSAQLFAVLAQVTPEIEGLSLDEAFLDVTASQRLLGDLQKIGDWLRREIRSCTGLAASVGMAHNKLLAKLASELAKPDGNLYIRPEQVTQQLDPLPVGKLWTVGKVAEAKLHRLGVYTFAQLRCADPALLERTLGAHAAVLQRLARGEDERPVRAYAEEKSISAETTFDTDIDSLATAASWLLRFCERVGERLRGQGLKCRTVTVKLRVPPFVTSTRQAQLPDPIDTTVEIYKLARRLLVSWWGEQKRPALRLLGVGVSGFGDAQQDDLFARDRSRNDRMLDQINRRFGDGTVRRAGVLKTRQ